MNIIKRTDTKKVKVGNVIIGGKNQVVIQSMCNTDTSNVRLTVKQILELEDEGCEIIRVSVKDIESAKAIDKIKQKIHIPLVADIHYDYKLALMSIENGIDKIRINPGNIGNENNIKEIVKKCEKYKIPIRVGVNSGSIEKRLLDKYKNKKSILPLVESALSNVKILNKYDFDNIIISLKASNVLTCVKAYENIASKTKYPLHIGITEAGTLYSGNIKSSAGLAILLNEGIGDTMRVSLSCNPILEVRTAKLLLKSLGLKKDGIEVIACPTCSRTNIDIIKISKKIEDELYKIKNKNLKVAIMGCAVNGIGEAKDCDIGIAGGIGEAVLFKKGKIVRKIKEENIIKELLFEINKM